ncbi:MAG: hypothetical protein IJ279_08580 [Clostridia bacterium]|nr:hypothetical protein [Clostridia bacterium]
MIIENKVVFPHLCPVCKKHSFTEPFEVCPICRWINDVTQEEQLDLRRCGNIMSLNEAKKAFKEGKEII